MIRVHTNTNLHVLAGLLEANQKRLRLVVGMSSKRYALMFVKQETDPTHIDGSEVGDGD